MAPPGDPPQEKYQANIVYDYRVSGRSYSSSRVTSGDYSHDRTLAQALLQRYPIEAHVTVHYSPNDPSVAVLETGVTEGIWFFPVGAIIFLACGMFIGAIRMGVIQNGRS